MIEALLAFLGILLTGGMGALGVMVAQLYRRLDNVEDEYRELWDTYRYNLDLYYRNRTPGAPDPQLISPIRTSPFRTGD